MNLSLYNEKQENPNKRPKVFCKPLKNIITQLDTRQIIILEFKHSFLQGFPPPLTLSQKSIPPTFCFPPLNFKNLSPPPPLTFCGSPHQFIIFKFPHTQNFHIIYSWFAQTDLYQGKHLISCNSQLQKQLSRSKLILQMHKLVEFAIMYPTPGNSELRN